MYARFFVIVSLTGSHPEIMHGGPRVIKHTNAHAALGENHSGLSYDVTQVTEFLNGLKIVSNICNYYLEENGADGPSGSGDEV